MHRSHWSFQYGLGVQVGVVLQFKLWHWHGQPTVAGAPSGCRARPGEMLKLLLCTGDWTVLSLATQLEVGCLVVASSFKLGGQAPLRLAGSPPGPGRRTDSGIDRQPQETQSWITHHSCQSRRRISVKLTAQALIIEAQLHTAPLRIK